MHCIAQSTAAAVLVIGIKSPVVLVHAVAENVNNVSKI